MCNSRAIGAGHDCNGHPECKGCTHSIVLPDPVWIGVFMDENGKLLIPTFRGVPVLPEHLTLYKNAGMEE